MKNKFQISNFKYPISNKGFTLMEMLVVISIFGVLGTIVTISLFSLLRSSVKTEVIKDVKQNGDFALSVMQVKLRNAIGVTSDCAGTGSSSVTIRNSDNTETKFSCVSAALQEQVVAAPVPVATPNPSQLTGTSVAVSDCSTVFTCTNNLSGYKNIKTEFTLTQAGPGGNVAETASELFQTQVTLRNK